MENNKLLMLVKKLVVIAALAGAIIAAYERGNNLAYIGIAFYTVCAIAVLISHRRTSLLLWFAVLVHLFLVIYIIWDWQSNEIIPCIYCIAAAGFALLAAVAWWKTPVAVLPAILIVALWYTWPMIFYAQPAHSKTEGKLTVPAAVGEETTPADATIKEIHSNNTTENTGLNNIETGTIGKVQAPQTNQTVKTDNNASTEKTNQQPAVVIPVEEQSSDSTGQVVNEPTNTDPPQQDPAQNDADPKPEPPTPEPKQGSG
ncbi:hypothetical protein [Sporotomaculum syntrophicum]|uniref:hypothetical protein n=1 Tax=Sporotomaculum syntrophicum TaxID=182264 RepID=UPI00137B818B|nr:hypothetical protein [Sporotomaculum syntrophicum]